MVGMLTWLRALNSPIRTLRNPLAILPDIMDSSTISYWIAGLSIGGWSRGVCCERPDDGRPVRRLRRLPHRHAGEQGLEAAQVDPRRPGHGPDAPYALPPEGPRPARVPYLDRPARPDGRAVLAQRRAARTVRPRRLAAAPPCVAGVQPPGRYGRRRRHLARDVPGLGGQIRDAVRQHAPLRPRHGRRAPARGGQGGAGRRASRRGAAGER